ncbi:hypothetical protein ABDK96_12430 [Citricoccus nitrophenolicus]|uniref:Uncharacterized protein n=1 Tax=Citricoccus nitrophenolicus TaxID=863575 RepID=A0ABV0IK03_9MICC
MTENPQQPYGAPGQQQPYGNPAFAGQDQPGSKYGTSAYDSGAVGQPMAEPKKWGLLKTLTLVSFAAYVISGILGFFGLDEETIRTQLQDQMEAQGQAVSGEQLDQIVSAGVVGGMAFAIGNLVVAVVLYLVVFFGLRKAKNWARILGTVLAAVGALVTAYGLFGIGTMMDGNAALGIVSLILSIAYIVVNIVWIVIAFSKENNAYVASRA